MGRMFPVNLLGGSGLVFTGMVQIESSRKQRGVDLDNGDAEEGQASLELVCRVRLV
jgi:hypothetical protein